jgi:shikimate kinase/3-dehydroquinate synthase
LRDLPPKTLLLGGFMGSGKTTIGRVVAERAGVPFVDLDAVVERMAGQTVAALFSAQGEGAFRALEAAALADELSQPAPRVIALGGGTLVDAKARSDALRRAQVVTLVARPSTLVERTRHGDRPLLRGGDAGARIRELLSARATAYANAHARISSEGSSIEGIAAAVHRAWADPAVLVALGPRSYAVRIADDAAAAAAEAAAALHPTSTFIVTDETVQPLWAQPLRAALEARGLAVPAVIALPPGEQNKTLASVEQALSCMIDAGADRDSVVVALGGGVLSDIAGFAAATLLRGVRWLVVPTTLLAMVDASVGGKTAVDLGPAKNAVGAFHQPSGVVVGASYVATEHARGYVSGLAEVVKASVIGDPALFERLEHDAAPILGRDPPAIENAVLGAISVKAGIVARDEREDGERALLNFGHSVGHALEAHGAYSTLTHGEAVSLGMVAMLRVGESLGVTDPIAAARTKTLLVALGLPTDLRAHPVEDALTLLSLDKKRRGDMLRVVLLRTIGAAEIVPMPLPELRRLLRDALASP